MGNELPFFAKFQDWKTRKLATRSCGEIATPRKKRGGSHFLFSFQASSEATCSLVFPLVSMPSRCAACRRGSFGTVEDSTGGGATTAAGTAVAGPTLAA